MALEQILKDATGRIRSGLLKNEAQVKQAVIIPILRALDWDDSDPKEFVPEFPVDNGQVDYALCEKAGRPLVFVEAKRLDGADDKGEEQLFGYASNKGIPFLILTDGNVWNFYLSMAAGLPVERRFYRIELQREENTIEYIEFLESCLLKHQVLSGQAKKEAERRHEDKLGKEKARNVIPSVWRTLLEKPDDMLRDVLIEAVQSECGTMPDLDDVEKFLKGFSSSHVPASLGELQPLGSPRQTRNRQTPNKRIIGFTLHGKPVETGAGNRTLAEILKELQRRDSGFMARFASKTVGRTRRLVAENPNDLYQKSHLKDDHSLNLENGWWLGINLSKTSIRNNVKVACEVAGVSFGKQLTLIER